MNQNNTKEKPKLGLYPYFWILLTASFIICIVSQVSKFTAYSKKEAELLDKIAIELVKEKEMNREAEYYKSDAFIEKIAREELGFIRDDEYIFFNEY